MSVSMPPKLEANASGISNLLLLKPACADILTTMGIINATVPVLLTKAPIKDVLSITSKNALRSLPLASDIIRLPPSRARPVCNNAPPTTNNPTIIITTGEANPARASEGESTPVNINTHKAATAVTSLRHLPHINIATVSVKVIIVIAIVAQR